MENEQLLLFPVEVFTKVFYSRRVTFPQSGFCIAELKNLPQITQHPSVDSVTGRHSFKFPIFFFLSRSLSSCWGTPRLRAWTRRSQARWDLWWDPLCDRSHWAPVGNRHLTSPHSYLQCLPLPGCISSKYSLSLKRLHWRNFFIGQSFYF